MTVIALDPGAMAFVHGVREDCECVLERIDDGALLLILRDVDDDLILELHLRKDFLDELVAQARARAADAA